MTREERKKLRDMCEAGMLLVGRAKALALLDLLDAAEEALTWYAEPEVYEYDKEGDNLVSQEKGRRAREFLWKLL